MNIDTIYEKKILCEFVYSPLKEMLCALHVLYKSDHHLHRKTWIDTVNEHMSQELKKEIIEVGEFTEGYIVPLDFMIAFAECNNLSVLSSIEFLEDVPLYKITKIIKTYDINRKITEAQYSRLINLLKSFYINVFSHELKYIEPMMVRVLKKKSSYAKEKGIMALIDSIHERIKIEDEEIVFYKYREFRMKWADIKKITINISTFISPHLLLGYNKNSLDLTVLLELQHYEKEAPKDLEKVLKALGDGTRLRILKEISKKGKTTQELSTILNVSEAAVSKALKLLYQAKIVDKKRSGNYLIYTLNKLQIDYLPYKIYEYLMR
ncbi:DNA-binding transcriptional regulator, ArsR family [Hathewaya proteolytica DSM 3090]|uniref:DNA-binding transcriptional regulator, ArsR family n=1 Tax=Hathewaya proteolytica DSM 3090 TaxID=1121331 RepID=A0A1M6RA16_9CLOT|nr:metalloregulator ArsR/SmtB family transcription factor [Hathewaya proteolytica]SHK29266.1 DNA-binding transcriptional regulator, ArsR family [Hathewaya proteolytica DSM 3090]